MIKKILTIAAGLSSAMLMPYSSQAGETVDAALADYAKASGVSGNVVSVGSDTLANLMTLWAEEFKGLYPNVTVQIQAAGSSTAPPALIEGASNFGPMSRAMKKGLAGVGAESRRSRSRSRGAAESSPARPSRSSVVWPMAEAHTTGRTPLSLARSTRRAALRMRSAVASEVPPNLSTAIGDSALMSPSVPAMNSVLANRRY